MLLRRADRFNAHVFMVRIGRADQRKVSFIWDCENDPPILALEKIAFVMVVKLTGHDVTPAHKPHAFSGVDPHGTTDDFFHPRAASIYQHTGLHNAWRPALRFKPYMPDTVDLLC